MATITKSRRAPAYCPTPAEIAAATAEIRAKHRAMIEAGAVPPEPETLVVKTPEQAAAATAKEREYHRVWLQKRRAAARDDREAEANLTLQQNDQSEPIDLDDHRDPRQTEQWLPVPTVIVPTTAPPAEPNDWAAKLERQRRELIQLSWDSRREQRELAADADRRGVLNFYNINRTARAKMRLDGVEFDQQEMSPRDIANVELLELGAVDDALAMLIDAGEAQLEMEELNCRWSIVGAVAERLSGTVSPKPPHDVVAFRSKRK